MPLLAAVKTGSKPNTKDKTVFATDNDSGAHQLRSSHLQTLLLVYCYEMCSYIL